MKEVKVMVNGQVVTAKVVRKKKLKTWAIVALMMIPLTVGGIFGLMRPTSADNLGLTHRVEEMNNQVQVMQSKIDEVNK